MNGAIWIRIGCVAIAGAAGALCRWGLAEGMRATLGARWDDWHFGTLVANVLGCFCFGLLYQILPAIPEGGQIRLILLTGFMGAFTTFSAFTFDTYDLQLHRGAGWALANVGAHVILGWFALLLGMSAGRSV